MTTLESLSEEQIGLLRWFRMKSDWLAENKAEEFNHLLGSSSGEEIDVSTQSPDEAMYMLLEALDTDVSATSERLGELNIPTTDAIVSEMYANMQADRSSRSICNDWAALNWGEDALCEYENEDGTSGDFTWYSGESIDDGSSSWWNDAGNQALEILDDIGWDNIFGALFGDDDETTPSGGGGGDDEDDDDDETGTNWTTVAMVVSGVLVVGIGAYFLFKRRK